MHSIFSAHCGMAAHRISISHRPLVPLRISCLPAAAPKRRHQPRVFPAAISSVFTCFVDACAVFRRPAIVARFRFRRKRRAACRHGVCECHLGTAAATRRVHFVSQHQCLVRAARECVVALIHCSQLCSDATGTISVSSAPLLISVLKCTACATSPLALGRTIAELGASRCVFQRRFVHSLCTLIA